MALKLTYVMPFTKPDIKFIGQTNLVSADNAKEQLLFNYEERKHRLRLQNNRPVQIAILLRINNRIILNYVGNSFK